LQKALNKINKNEVNKRYIKVQHSVLTGRFEKGDPNIKLSDYYQVNETRISESEITIGNQIRVSFNYLNENCLLKIKLILIRRAIKVLI